MTGKNKKVAVAMSGGVDSSVAAALLKDRGYDVFGITMDLYGSAGLCSRGLARRGREMTKRARQVADALSIRHHVVDFSREFNRRVIESFIREYRSGRTPNPCVRCNETVKFGKLWEKARRLGADFLATGHYARIAFDPDAGIYRLFKGVDSGKDQSYFLWPLTQAVLARTLLPLGELEKKKVRKLAGRLKLPAAVQPESQEVCFIPDGTYSDFLKDRDPGAFRPGPVRDTGGKSLGEHEGLPAYTIGQRKRLRLKTPEAYYVVRIDPAENALIVGKKNDLDQKFMQVEGANWVGGNDSTPVFVGQVKIRSRHDPAEAVVRAFPDRAEIEFLEKQRAITPGQSAVFYSAEEVVGGGIIARSK